MERDSCGFTEVVVDSISHVTIFIRWSGVSFYLYSYHDIMHFHVVNIMIHKFLSASRAWKRKPRPTPTQRNLSSMQEHSFFKPISSPETSINEWVLFSLMLTAVWWLWRLHWMLEAGKGGISSGIPAMLCLMMRTHCLSFSLSSFSNFNLQFLCPSIHSRLDFAASN